MTSDHRTPLDSSGRVQEVFFFCYDYFHSFNLKHGPLSIDKEMGIKHGPLKLIIKPLNKNNIRNVVISRQILMKKVSLLILTRDGLCNII